jgi:gamma-glutamyltranspeptidase/glutathione hydrolase
VAAELAGHVQRVGGLLSAQDLATHRGEWVQPVCGSFRDVEVVQLPPNSQGTAALLALNLVEMAGALPAGVVERQHLLIEAVKVALAERDSHLTDPLHMRLPPAALASLAWAESCRHRLGPRAATMPPGRAARGGTVYLCAADSSGRFVSLIQSNYTGFGSGVTVPGFGLNLQNRGAYFSLDPGHVNVIGPSKRTLHTLMPAMALRDGRPWLIFGTMGADGQAQTQVQILSRLLDEADDLAAAIAAPRWFLDPADWALLVESRFPSTVVDGLRNLGHRLAVAPRYDALMGHAQAILVTPGGFAATSDPRCEGLASGF